MNSVLISPRKAAAFGIICEFVASLWASSAAVGSAAHVGAAQTARPALLSLPRIFDRGDLMPYEIVDCIDQEFADAVCIIHTHTDKLPRIARAFSDKSSGGQFGALRRIA